MEFSYSQIDNLFSDYIIQLIGPNAKQDLYRENKFKIIKLILEKAFCEQGITPHIFKFGSFPIRTYLPESDMDVTIILEDTSSNQIIINPGMDYQNKILNLIQYTFENYNQEVGYAHITEINLIPAEVKLIKCKFDNLSFDISINNFVGLFKLSFMNYLENKIFDNTKGIFKRTLFLIKCWSYYEASILGSNVGLMASYALEVLIIYMFNNYSDKFSNEVEATFFFFELMSEVDWNNKIVTLFGFIDINSYYNNLKNSQYNLDILLQNVISNGDSKIKLDDITNFIKNNEKLPALDKFQNIGKKAIEIRLLNIIDPLFHNNNLGKSINFHNLSKINSVFQYATNEASIINTNKRNKTISPFDYLNSLMKIFSKIIVINNPELFYQFLPQPKIMIFSNDKMYCEDDEVMENNIEKDKIYPNKLNENLVKKFNKQFRLNLAEDVTFTINEETQLANYLWPSNSKYLYI